MRYKELNLAVDTVTTYDKTKNYLAGRAYLKNINGEDVVGPALTRAIDVFTDSGGAVTPGGIIKKTSNGRFFLLGATAAGGVLSIAYYDHNQSTGASTYRGRIVINLPNGSASTTHTPRDIRVIDTGTTGWKIFITTVATPAGVVTNGGLFLVNNVDASDFSTGPSPITLIPQFVSNSKGVYMLADPAGIGSLNNLTSLMGMGLRTSDGHLIVTNGTAASLTIQGFDSAVAPTITTGAATTAPGSGSATWTRTAHGFNNNDPVIFTTTGTAPTGFTASTSVLHQVYFARNVTANTFELSATIGGASITATGAGSGTFTSYRAYGLSTAAFLSSRKTGTITTGFAGTAILIGGQVIQQMTESLSPNFNQDIYFFPTTTNFYNFRISDIVAGATTLPSAQSINNTGTGTDIVTPTTVFATYSQVLNRIVYNTSTFSWMMKRWKNSQLTNQFGGQANTWLENTGAPANYFRGSLVLGGDIQDGWMFVTINTTGQRIVFAIDLRSDTSFNYSYVTSKVTKIGRNAAIKFVATIEELYDITDTLTISIKSAPTSGDSVFDDPTTGWTQINVAEDLSSYSIQEYVQLRAQFDVSTLLSGIPTQVKSIILGYDLLNENSEHWFGDVENSTKEADSPARSAAILVEQYETVVPAIQMTAFSRSTGAIVLQKNTTSHASEFQYSADNGSTWNALGTIPNAINTTRLRYNWSAPIPQDVDIAWSEL